MSGKWIRQIGSKLINLLFPIECLGCGREGFFVCEECFYTIPYRFSSSCLFCRAPSSEGRACLQCAAKHSIDGVLIAGDYDNSLLRRAIKAFKYNFIEEFKKPLGKFLAEYVQGYDYVFAKDKEMMIIPMPLAKKRLLERGFNQAELLASEVAAKFESSVCEPPHQIWCEGKDILIRQRATDQQVGLSEQERQENMAGAFVVKNKEIIEGRTILLIDDVVTTGVTLEECAKVLKNAGAKEVWGAVLAKG